METIPAVFLIIGTALAWLGVTVFAILRYRRRGTGSTVMASSAAADDQAGKRRVRAPRRARAGTGRTPRTPARRLSLKVRKVRH